MDYKVCDICGKIGAAEDFGARKCFEVWKDGVLTPSKVVYTDICKTCHTGLAQSVLENRKRNEDIANGLLPSGRKAPIFKGIIEIGFRKERKVKKDKENGLQ